ncbi:MAG: hypothetical protein GY787_28250 [Alteromonadales bacterium]|nr:hypothetical protein [Alteromonadales bacterium]
MNKCIILSSILLSNFAWASSSIILESDQGDWIGGGQSHHFTEGLITSINSEKITISHENGFRFTFTPPSQQQLKAGVFVDAERNAFKSPFNPGMDISSSGKGCNKLAGEFYVYELDSSALHPKLAMDFVQYCDSTTKKLTGSIRINSDIEVPYPNPIAIIRNDNNIVIEQDEIHFDANSSFANNTYIQHFDWQIISGPRAILVPSYSGAISTQLVEPIALGGEDLTVKLTVTDEAGLSSSSLKTINIKSKSDPQTYFTMNSESGDYIGAGKKWYYHSGNSNISASQNYDNGVSIRIQGSESWSAQFAAPDDQLLTDGEYAYATRFPLQDAGDAGLTISGNGRGCNKSYGNFTISQLVWSGEQVNSFKASYEQHCENSGAQALTGEVAFNALNASVPIADAGIDITVNEYESVVLNGSDSFDRLGTIASYLWTSNDSEIDLYSETTSRGYFIAPALADRIDQQTFIIDLLVIDDQGFQAKDTIKVTVLANNQAPTAENDSTYVYENNAVIITPLDNDIDNDGNLAIDSIILIEKPTKGTAIVDAQGQINYQHSGAESGQDIIRYAVKDNDGQLSNVATIIITIKDKIIAPEYPTFVVGETQVQNGDVVSYQGQCYQANNNPGRWEAPKASSWFWNSFDCSTTVEPELPTKPGESNWDANKVYNAGDHVTVNGITYQANWWTKGQNPTLSSTGGVWSKV